MVGLIQEERIADIGPKDEIMVRGWSEGLRGYKSIILGSTIATEININRYRGNFITYSFLNGRRFMAIAPLLMTNTTS